MGPNRPFYSTFGKLTLNADDEEKQGSIISASTINKGKLFSTQIIAFIYSFTCLLFEMYLHGLVLILFCVSSLDLVVCGDVQGNMWFIQAPEPSPWSNRKHVGIERIW